MQTADSLGFELILLPYDDNLDGVREGLFCIDNVLRKKLGSMIIAVEEIDEVELEHLNEHMIPFVMINKELNDVQGDWIAIDWEIGMYKIVKYLIDLGYRDFGYLGGLLGKFPSDRQKYIGVKRALSEAGIAMTLDLFVEWAYEKRNEVSKTAEELLKMIPRPGVIICADDHFGAQVIKICYQLGLRIPQDIAVTGTGDFNIASNIYPGLTTLYIDRYKIGQQAMMIIGSTKANSKRSDYAQIKIEPELVIRGSIDSMLNSQKVQQRDTFA